MNQSKTDLFEAEKSKYYSTEKRENDNENDDLETAQVVFRPLFRYKVNVATKIVNGRIYQAPVRRRLVVRSPHHDYNYH